MAYLLLGKGNKDNLDRHLQSIVFSDEATFSMNETVNITEDIDLKRMPFGLKNVIATGPLCNIRQTITI